MTVNFVNYVDSIQANQKVYANVGSTAQRNVLDDTSNGGTVTDLITTASKMTI